MGGRGEGVEAEQAVAVRADEVRERSAFDVAFEAGPEWRRQPRHKAAARLSRKRRLPPIRAWFVEQLSQEARFGHGFLWIPVAMAAGAAAELAAPRDIPLTALLVPLVLLALLAIGLRRHGRRGAAITVAAAALFAGMTAAAVHVRLAGTSVLDAPVVTHVRGIVLSREAISKGGFRYLVRISSTSEPVIRRPPEQVRLVARGRHAPIGPGQGIGGLARLLPPSGPVLPGGFDFGFKSYFEGVGAIGFFYGAPHRADVASVDRPGPMAILADAVAALRQTMESRIREVLPGEAGALAAALIVANRRGISEPTVAALRDAGLAHILAISGLHMALVAGTVYLMVRLLSVLSITAAEGRPLKKFAAAAALVVATAYLVISGAAVSTLRAWIMLTIVLVAVILDRPALTLRNVAIAAIAIILTNPAAVVGPSFQMSFAATTALIAGYSALRQFRARRTGAATEAGPFRYVLRFAGAIAFTSLVAGSATGIFAAYHFQRIAALGVAGNLLAMPLITFVVMPMGLVATLLMPYGLERWPLEVMGGGLHLVIAIAYKVEAFGGTVRTGRMPLAVFFLFLGGFTLLVLLRSRLRMAGIAAILAALALDMSPFATRRPDILISEDGRLVGLPTDNGIATNRRRPSSFVLDQWAAALADIRKISPVKLPVSAGLRTTARRRGKPETAVPPDPESLAAMRSAVRLRAKGFLCYGEKWCVARVGRGRGLPVATVADPAYLGPACDLARIVIVQRPVQMTACRSGALLLTGRSLRRTGSVAIAVDRLDDNGGRARNGHERSGNVRREDRDTRTGFSGETGAAYRLTIRTALGGVLRPWTVQRYYDWRSRSYDFTAARAKVRTLVIAAD